MPKLISKSTILIILLVIAVIVTSVVIATKLNCKEPAPLQELNCKEQPPLQDLNWLQSAYKKAQLVKQDNFKTALINIIASIQSTFNEIKTKDPTTDVTLGENILGDFVIVTLSYAVLIGEPVEREPVVRQVTNDVALNFDEISKSNYPPMVKDALITILGTLQLPVDEMLKSSPDKTNLILSFAKIEQAYSALAGFALGKDTPVSLHG